jgi:two-component system response regulator CpxR
MQMLIVDDSPEVCLMFRYILEMDGYQVVVAEDGQEALDFLRATSEMYVVIMGGAMPVKDGRQTIEEALRDESIARRLVFIPCSASASYLRWATEFLRLPAVAVLPKPVKPSALRAAVIWGITRLDMRQSNHHT